MTLLVIQNDEIFVDSFQDMNGYAFSSNKVLSSSIGKFAVIGNFASVRGTNSRGLQFAGGSGYHSFMAYFAEHGDVTKAFELCAAYHREVELPIGRF